MRRILLVDAGDLRRRFVSVDDSPHPVPRLDDLKPGVRREAEMVDAVFYVTGDHDPVILRADHLETGKYRWSEIPRIAVAFSSSPQEVRATEDVEIV